MDWWCRCDAGGAFKACWIQLCSGTRSGRLSTRCFFLSSQTEQGHWFASHAWPIPSTIKLFHIVMELMCCYSPAISMSVSVPHSLPSSVTSNKQQWTVSSCGFPSDPLWRLKDWTNVALAKLFNIYHVNVEMFKKRIEKKNSKQGKLSKKIFFSLEIRTYFFYKDMLYHLSVVVIIIIIKF